METTIINLSSVTPSKEYLRGFAERIKNDVENGHSNPLRLSVILNFVGKCCADALSQIKEETIKEIESSPERKEFFGYKIEVAEAGVQYDYSKCGDPKMNELLSKMEDLKEEIKARETFLKGIKDRENIVTEDGEIVTVRPPSRKSTTSTKFTLK